MSTQVKLWQSVVVTLLISALTASLGYSVSQMQLSGTVAVVINRVSTIEKSQEIQDLTLKDFDKRSTEHMNKAVDLFETQMSVQRDFIAMLKVQNETMKAQNDLISKLSK